jgi:hypothetical protein
LPLGGAHPANQTPPAGHTADPMDLMNESDSPPPGTLTN